MSRDIFDDDGPDEITEESVGNLRFWPKEGNPVNMTFALAVSAPRLEERLLRSEQLNAELARMLKSLEWSYGVGGGCCYQCSGTKQVGHVPDCALAALLKKARTE